MGANGNTGNARHIIDPNNKNLIQARVEARPITWVDFILTNPASLDAVKSSLIALLKYPEPDTLQRAMHSLRFFCCQIWTTGVVYHAIKNTPNPTLKKSLPMPVLDIGNLIQRCNVLFQDFPNTVAKPTLMCILNPPQLSEDGKNSVLHTLLQKRTSVYFSESLKNGKAQTSAFVEEAAYLMLFILGDLDKMFKLQCWATNSDSEEIVGNIKLCTPLFQIASLLTEAFKNNETDVLNCLKAVISCEIENAE